MLAESEYEGVRTTGYLDSATYGLPSRATQAAAHAAVDAWRDWENWHHWEAEGEACRALFAQIVGARADQIALLSATSVAAGLVAASIPAGGTNVVVYERDFHSNLFPWLVLEGRGVEVRLAALEGLADACDENTSLVAVSAVQSADGRVADLAALKSTGARVFVDATQAAGAFPLDLSCVDYLAASAYKWLCCPRGLCFLYVADPTSVPPILAGWKSRTDAYSTYYGPPLDLTGDARRFDTSLAWHVAAGGRPALELIARLGVERIAEHDLALARRFCAGLELPEPESPIVRVELPETAVERLEAAGVRCAGRAGAVRFSFHLYNDEADVDLALDALDPSVVFASEA